MAACYGAGALACLLARWSGRLALGAGHLAALAGAVAGLGVSLGVLLGTPLAPDLRGGPPLPQPLPALFPFARLSLAVDGLSAYFLLVISFVAVAAALYGPAYLRAHSPDAGKARRGGAGGGAPRRHDADAPVLPGAGGLRHQGRCRAAPRLAASRAPRGPEPRLGAHVGRHAQGRDLRDTALRLRSARPRGRAAAVLLGMDGVGRRHALGRARRAVRASAARPEAPARVPQRRERRDHPDRGGARDAPVARGRRGHRPRDRGAHRLAPPYREPRGVQGPALPRRGQRPLSHAPAQHGGARRARPAHALDGGVVPARRRGGTRSEKHTSELPSRLHLGSPPLL